jgi:hypothetical protein
MRIRDTLVRLCRSNLDARSRRPEQGEQADLASSNEVMLIRDLRGFPFRPSQKCCHSNGIFCARFAEAYHYHFGHPLLCNESHVALFDSTRHVEDVCREYLLGTLDLNSTFPMIGTPTPLLYPTLWGIIKITECLPQRIHCLVYSTPYCI